MMLNFDGMSSLRLRTLGTHGLLIHLTALPLDVPPHWVQKMVLSHLSRECDRSMPCQGCPAGTLMLRLSRLYMKTGMVPEADMAKRIASATYFDGAAVRSDCTLFLNFLRAVA